MNSNISPSGAASQVKCRMVRKILWVTTLRIAIMCGLCLISQLPGGLASAGGHIGAQDEVSHPPHPVKSYMTLYYLPFTTITEVQVTQKNATIELDKMIFTDHRVMESIYRYLRQTRRRGNFDSRAIRLVVEPFGQHRRYEMDTQGVVRAAGRNYSISARDYCLLNELLRSYRKAQEESEGPPIPVN